MPMRLLPLLLTVSVGAGGCATSPADAPASAEGNSPRQCFWASGITGFSDAGPDRALVSIGNRATWALTLSPGCPDVDWAMRIGIVSRGSERICSGQPAELLIPTASGRGAQRCLVREVRKLSPGEAASGPKSR
jgi:hypothetical protein